MKKKRMQVFSLALAALLCLGLFAGCSGDSEETTAPTDSAAPVTETPETEAPETEAPETETPAPETLSYTLAEVVSADSTSVTVKLYAAPEGTVVDAGTYTADGFTLGETTETVTLGSAKIQKMEGDSPVTAAAADLTAGSLIRLARSEDGQLQELLILLAAEEPAVDDSGTGTNA